MSGFIRQLKNKAYPEYRNKHAHTQSFIRGTVYFKFLIYFNTLNFLLQPFYMVFQLQHLLFFVGHELN